MDTEEVTSIKGVENEDADKQGKVFGQFKIEAPAAIFRLQPDHIIITPMGYGDYFNLIKSQIDERGIAINQL